MGVHRSPGLGQRGIAGAVDDALVDLLVVAEVRGQLAAGVVGEHVIVQRADVGDVGFGRIAAGQLTGQRLQRAEHDEDFLHFFRLQRCHHGAAVGQQLDQAFGGEELDRLAQGCARGAQPFGQHALVELGLRRQFALHDQVAQLVDHGFMQQPALGQ